MLALPKAELFVVELALFDSGKLAELRQVWRGPEVLAQVILVY